MAVKYVLVISDKAEMDRDRLFLSKLGSSPDFSKQWEDGLSAAVDDLTGFPGPLSHAKDEEATALYGREVRRLLYFGPTRRRTGTPVRILFAILPPDSDEPPETAESVILLLRLLHGAQMLVSDSPAEE